MRRKINHDFIKNIFRDLGLMEDSLLETFTKKRNYKKNLIRFMRIILREKKIC